MYEERGKSWGILPPRLTSCSVCANASVGKGRPGMPWPFASPCSPTPEGSGEETQNIVMSQPKKSPVQLAVIEGTGICHIP